MTYIPVIVCFSFPISKTSLSKQRGLVQSKVFFERKCKYLFAYRSNVGSCWRPYTCRWSNTEKRVMNAVTILHDMIVGTEEIEKIKLHELAENLYVSGKKGWRSSFTCLRAFHSFE